MNVNQQLTAFLRVLVTGMMLLACHAAWSILPEPLPPDPPVQLFRYDDRSPDLIFDHGFIAAGRDINLINHLLGVGIHRQGTADNSGASPSGLSAFIATSARESAVRRMVRGRLQPAHGDTAERRVWIYTVRASGRFFGVRRSLQRAMDRMADCESSSGEFQARLATLDGLLNVGRAEAEWVAYRSIPPSLIHHATQYRLDATGRDIEEIPGTRLDNPQYVPGNSHGNTTPWLLDGIPRPMSSFLYRVHNHGSAAAMNLYERIRNGSFGAQFCSPPAASRSERDNVRRLMPREAEIEEEIQRVVKAVLADELHDLATSGICVMLPFYSPTTAPPPSDSNGSCEAPEPVRLDQLPNGYAWVNDAIVMTMVPWASWNTDNMNGKKNRPVFCQIDPGIKTAGRLQVSCQPNEFFTDFVLRLRAALGNNRIDVQFRGKTGGAGIVLSAEGIPLQGQGQLLQVAHGNPVRQARLIGEVFNSRDWHSSIMVAPVYTWPADRQPTHVIHDEL